MVITAERIARIAGFDSGGLPVTSIYVGLPVDPGDRAPRGRAASLMHDLWAGFHGAGLGRQGRLSVRADLERIELSMAQEPWQPGTAAIFACSGAGLYEEVALPRLVRDRIVVDATPWVRPMVAVLDEYARACVAVVDRERARVWELYQGEMAERGTIRDETLRKPDYAGWGGFDEYRVHNKAGELAKRHFRRVAAQVAAVSGVAHCELLIVGGHRDEVPCFAEELPHDLRRRVAGTFTVDPTTAPMAEIRGCATAVLERYEREHEQRRVAEVLGRAAAGGAAATGLDDCLWGSAIRAIGVLLVQDGAQAPGVVCDRDTWLARSGDVCPFCGGPTRRTPDVVDELVEAVIDEGGAIEHVLADTALREHTVAAALRYRLPPRPEG